MRRWRSSFFFPFPLEAEWEEEMEAPLEIDVGRLLEEEVVADLAGRGSAPDFFGVFATSA